MSFTAPQIVFFVLLLDSLSVNLLAWTSGDAWYRKNFRTISRAFPLTKGWSTYYLLLVLWIGWLSR